MKFQGLMSVLAVSATLLLSGCDKPPACGDDATLKTVREVITEQLQKELKVQSKNDPDGWVQKFIGSVQVKLSRIVSEGYKEDAKKQLCSASLSVSSLAGEVGELPVKYSTQTTEDKGASFMIAMDGAMPIVDEVMARGDAYYRSNRWNGDWVGTYSCQGIDGQQTGPQGPFRQRVTLVVKGTEGHMQRTAAGGGYEKVGGNFVIDAEGQVTIELGGPGQNSPLDRWVAEFAGPVDGNRLQVPGVIRLSKSSPNEQEQVLRRCELELTLLKGAAAKISSETMLKN